MATIKHARELALEAVTPRVTTTAAEATVVAAAAAAAAAQTTANNAATAASNAQTTANTANTNANSALTSLTNLTSDNILSPSEKPSIKLDYDNLINEQAGIDAQAVLYSITTERTTYNNAVAALTSYLNTSCIGWDSIPGGEVSIVGTTFRSTFATVYSARQALLNKISANAKILADAAQGTANTASTNASTALVNAATAQTAANNAQTTATNAANSATNAQNTANTASTNASAALTALTNLTSDNILSPSEKPSVKLDYDNIVGEQSGIDAQAVLYGITTEKTAYDSAITALTTYLNTSCAGWNTIPGSDVSIVGTTFRTNFAAVYAARQTLLNKITSNAKTIADGAQTTANNAATAASTAQTTANNAATAASAAQTTANNAATAASTANTSISNLASDNILSPGEKPSIKLDYDNIINEKLGIEAQASAYAIITEKNTYSDSIAALTSYLNSSCVGWDIIPGSDVSIVGTTFRSTFAAVYTARQALLNKIAEVAGRQDFSAAYTWNFAASLESFTFQDAGASINTANGTLTVSSSGSDPIFRTPAISVVGGIYTKVRMRLRRVAGSGQEFVVYYATTGHGESGLYVNNLGGTLPISSTFSILEWDMANLTQGGSDWINSTITQIRFDLGNSASDVFEIDWISVGTSAPSNYTTLDTLGNLVGAGTATGTSVANNRDGIVDAPGGGSLVTSASVVNGAILIVLPVFFTDTMLRFKVEIYEYIQGYSTTMEIGGYTYGANNSWVNVTAIVTGGNIEYPVYFGHNGTKACVWIGSTSETWAYPQVRVSSVVLGYTNYSKEMWQTGWLVATTTAPITAGLGAGQYSASVLDTMPGADWAKSTRRPANLAALAGSEGINNALLEPSISAAATTAVWGSVTGTGKPSDNATSDISLVVSGTGLVLTGNACYRASGGGSWDSKCKSINSYTGGAYCSFVATNPSYFMAGLSTNPDAGMAYNHLNYAFYIAADNRVRIYESNVYIGDLAGYSTNDVLAICYDGQSVKYTMNGLLLREVAALPNLKLYFDSSIVTYGLGSIRFLPYTTTSSKGKNLIDASWWAVGAPLRWTPNDANGSVTDFTTAVLPDGSSQVVMRATAGNLSNSQDSAGGGWTTGSDMLDVAIDRSKTYLFALYVYKHATGTIPGNVFWGLGSPTGIATLNTTTNDGNPYFAISNLPNTGRWYLMVGKVHPYSSTGHNSDTSGTYDCITGNLVGTGLSFNWSDPAAGQSSRVSTRFYQYYSNGGVTYAYAPQVYLCDGSEPSLQQLLSISFPTRIGQAATTATWSGVTGTGRPSDNATSDLSLIGTGVSLIGNTATKTAPGGSFDAQVYSKDSFTGGSYAVATAATSSYNMMFGLNSDPTTDASYTSIDYAIYLRGDSVIEVYMGGAGYSTGALTYTVGDTFAVVYDGTYVKFYKNGVLMPVSGYGGGVVPAAPNLKLSFDSSFANVGASLSNIGFGPMSNTNWTAIGSTPANLAALGGTEQILNNSNSNALLHIMRPVGGSIGTSGITTGSIKVRLPQSWSGTMLRLQVDIYEYGSGGIVTYEVGGYNYSSGWINSFARYYGTPTFVRPVYFGHDGSYACIYIGTGGGTWSYPQVQVHDFVAGYSNYSEGQWVSNWGVTFEAGGPLNVSNTIAAPLSGGALSGVDQINTSNSSTLIAPTAITNALIGNYIKSNTWNGVINDSGVITTPGTTGWAIGKSGDAEFDAAKIRGKLTVGQLEVQSGANSTSFTSGTELEYFGSSGGGGGYSMIGLGNSGLYDYTSGDPILGTSIGGISVYTAEQSIHSSVLGYISLKLDSNWGGPPAGNHGLECSSFLEIYRLISGSSVLLVSSTSFTGSKSIMSLNPTSIYYIPIVNNIVGQPGTVIPGAYISVFRVYVNGYYSDTSSPLYCFSKSSAGRGGIMNISYRSNTFANVV